MAGEEDLTQLLSGMSPTLNEGDYIFCSFGQGRYGDHSELQPIAAIQEREGLTLIVPKSKADENKIAYESVFRCITLNVHSSLDAVGLTAKLSGRLAERGISANIVAGFFHDHIFVPRDLAKAAMAALVALSRENKNS